jgi:hypothetical protein
MFFNVFPYNGGVWIHKALLSAATHSTVPFPQDAFRKRIRDLASEFQSRALPKCFSDDLAKEVADALVAFLQNDKGFSVCEKAPRTALPVNAIVDHRTRFSSYYIQSVPY